MDVRVTVLVAAFLVAAGCGQARDGVGADAAPDALLPECELQQATPAELDRCGPRAPYDDTASVPCLGGAAYCPCDYGKTCGNGARWMECRCAADAVVWTCVYMHCDPIGPEDAGQSDAADAAEPDATDAGEPDAGQPRGLSPRGA